MSSSKSHSPSPLSAQSSRGTLGDYGQLGASGSGGGAGTTSTAQMYQSSNVIAPINPDDPYFQDLKAYETKLYNPASTKERYRAILEIGQISFIAGDAVQTHIGTTDILDKMVEIVASPAEPISEKLNAIQALSIIARNSRLNQDRLRKLNYLQILSQLLLDANEEARKWAAQSLFFLASGNVANQTMLVTIPDLQARLSVVANDNWKHWSHNDAEEVAKLLDLGKL